MRDHEETWARLPSSPSGIDRAGITVRELGGLSQLLVSGEIGKAARLAGIDGTGVGALGSASGERYAVRVARDRMLIVATAALSIGDGWHEDGFAVTAMSAGLTVFEIGGDLADDVVRRATTLSLSNPGPCAATRFADINGFLYRHEGALRLHVDRGLAAYVWQWLETLLGLMAAETADA
ncbi:MAG: hypothetical protein AB7S80_13170 [Rhizobiaceae bacterium]